MYFILLLLLPPILASDKIDFNKCMEISTYGYNYDAAYKMMPHTENGSIIEFFVKAKSDAHILLLINANSIEPNIIGLQRSNAIEVIIGGGRNTFSEIRKGSYGLKMNTKSHSKTDNILSEVEYRGFWIRLTTTNVVEVGQLNNQTAFLFSAFSTGDTMLNRFSFFAFSTWNNVKGHWKIKCPQFKDSEINGIEEMELTGIQKLRRDLTMFYETSVPPIPEDNPLINISLTANIHHFLLEENEVELHCYGKMTLIWHDWKLSWDPADYQNITSFRAPATDIWTPKLTVLMSSNIEAVMTEDSSANVLVKSDGSCTWMPRYVLQTFCELTMNNWPQDTHECQVPIVTQAFLDYTEFGAQVVFYAPTKQIEVLGGENEWKMNAEINDAHFESIFILFIHFTLKRNVSGFSNVFIAPFISGAVLILASFWLESEHKSKLHMTCCSTIIMTVFFLFFAELVPVFTKNCTILNLYTFGFLMSCLSTLHCIIIKNINIGTFEVPNRLKKFLTNPILQRCLCLNITLENPTVYESLKEDCGNERSKDSYLLSAVLEKIIFIIYLIVYISLILNYLH